jgi:hypothetical protein
VWGGWNDTSLLWGSDNTCTNVTRNGNTYCYWHYGLYRVLNGVAHRIVDTNSIVPGTAFNFISFGEGSDDNGEAVFVGYYLDADDRWQSGIYRAHSNGTLDALLNLASTDYWWGIWRPRVQADRVLFGGYTYDTVGNWEEGLFSAVNGVRVPVVTNRNSPTGGQWGWVDGWNYDTTADVLAFNAYGYSSTRGWRQVCTGRSRARPDW